MPCCLCNGNANELIHNISVLMIPTGNSCLGVEKSADKRNALLSVIWLQSFFCLRLDRSILRYINYKKFLNKERKLGSKGVCLLGLIK